MSEREQIWQQRFEWPIIVAALAVIPVMVIEDSGAEGVWPGVAAFLNWGSWAVFLAEVAVMLAVVSDRKAWLMRHPLDMVIVVLTPPFLPFLGARLLRLLRVLRLVLGGVRLSRFLSLDGVRVAAVVVVTTVLAGGAAFAAIETGHELSSWDGAWWAITTVTTVGYGDVIPETEAGRVIAILVMSVGIGFVALLTAFIADRFVRRDFGPGAKRTADREEEILVELRQLRTEVGELRSELGAVETES